jgi:hypothetical protein
MAQMARAPLLILTGKLEDGPLFLAKAQVEMRALDVWQAIQTPLARVHMAGSVQAIADEPIIGIDDDAASVAAEDARTPAESAALILAHKTAYLLLFRSLSHPDDLARLNDVPFGNGYEMWRRIHAHYSKTSVGSYSSWLSQFLQAKQKDGELAAAFSTRINDLAMTLFHMGYPQPHILQATTFYNGLSAHYKEIIPFGTRTCNKTLSDATDLAVEHEQRNPDTFTSNM